MITGLIVTTMLASRGAVCATLALLRPAPNMLRVGASPRLIFSHDANQFVQEMNQEHQDELKVIARQRNTEDGVDWTREEVAACRLVSVQDEGMHIEEILCSTTDQNWCARTPSESKHALAPPLTRLLCAVSQHCGGPADRVAARHARGATARPERRLWRPRQPRLRRRVRAVGL